MVAFGGVFKECEWRKYVRKKDIWHTFCVSRIESCKFNQEIKPVRNRRIMLPKILDDSLQEGCEFLDAADAFGIR